MAVISEKYLIMVTLNNNNKYYKMLPEASGSSFKVVYGRVGTSGTEKVYPISDWNKIYNSKIAKGYVDQTAIMNVAEQKSEVDLDEIKSTSVRDIVERLQILAKQTVKKNYRLSATQVTPEMVKEAERLLRELAAETNKIHFNRILMKLFETIPRKMSNVISFTARTDSEMGTILQREADLLDVLKGQMTTGKVLSKAKAGTILDALGLSFEECTKEELEEIKSHLDPEIRSRFKNAWAVRNKETDAAFEKYCKERNIKKVKYYYHGSRSENWWSIINNGLKLNPANVSINGKMFGYGIYFAPKAKKSSGYTSAPDACWTGGGGTSGFIAIYKIAYGKPYDVTDHQSRFYNFHEKEIRDLNCDCLHAHAGTCLLNDEVIVYNEAACTIRYLIEYC